MGIKEENVNVVGSTNNDGIFARNNNTDYISKQNVELPKVKLEVDKNRYIAFLTIEKVEDESDESFPIDYSKEEFDNINDAKEYINTMRSEGSEKLGDGDVYDGFVVSKDKEQEAENKLNQIINLGSKSGYQDYDHTKIYQESGEDEYFSGLNDFCKKGNITNERCLQFLMDNYDLMKDEAQTVLETYMDTKVLKEKKLKETVSNEAVMKAFISKKFDSNLHSTHLGMKKYGMMSVDIWGLINYSTVIAIIIMSMPDYMFINKTKYSMTTTKITDILEYLASQAGFNITKVTEGYIMHLLDPLFTEEEIVGEETENNSDYNPFEGEDMFIDPSEKSKKE